MKRLSLQHSVLLVVVASLAFIASSAFAAESIGGPVAGYAVSSSRTQLRAILGVPGALGFSDPLLLPDDVTQVRLAPGQDFALVERGAGAPGILFLKDGAVDRLAPIEGAMPSSDWAAFSPNAGSAILFSAAANRLQVLSGLPNAPKLALDLDAALLPDLPRLGAVSDDGTLVLLASDTSVYRVSKAGSKLVLSAGAVQSLTILRNGVDAAVAEPTTGSVYLLQNVAANAVSRVLASGLDGMGAIFPAWDGRSLFVTRLGTKAVSSIDLASGEVESFPAAAAPSELVPLRNHDTFLISARPSEPGWVFYRDGAAGRVVFIPAAKVSRGIPGKEGVR